MQLFKIFQDLPYRCPLCGGRMRVVGTSVNEFGRPVIGLCCRYNCDAAIEVEFMLTGERNTHAEGYFQYEVYREVANPYRDAEAARRFDLGVKDAMDASIPF